MEATLEKTIYPYIPAKRWWELRARFNQSWPSAVTSSYLQSILSIGEGHAQNMLSDLQQIGLVDSDGKPTELANDWRSDESYARVCEILLTEHYPAELREAFPPPNPDRQGVTRWFQRNLKLGHKAADKLASFYSLLCRGDFAEQERRAARPSAARSNSNGAGTATVRSPKRLPSQERAVRTHGGSGHVALHIQVSTDSTPEQIDAVFQSLRKHLLDSGSDSN